MKATFTSVGSFQLRSFTKRRLKKFNGVKVNFELHLKECEFRWRKSNDLIYNILLKQNLKERTLLV